MAGARELTKVDGEKVRRACTFVYLRLWVAQVGGEVAGERTARGGFGRAPSLGLSLLLRHGSVRQGGCCGEEEK